ncbi:NAD(P)H-dependent oxidoreductase [Microbacterium sp. MC2]
MALHLVTVSGSLRSPSTTDLLLDGIVAEIGSHLPVERTAVELHPLAVDLAVALTRGERSDAVTAALEAVAAAEVLVVATPIYRGSYTGLFKQFIDLVHHDALAGTPVLLAAGGGDDQHALSIDHELRPLFAFFRAHTLPVGVYARAADFAPDPTAPAGKRIADAGALPGAITRAVDAALPVLRAVGG